MGKATSEEEERLKYLEFVQVVTLHALMCCSRLYGYAKDNSGPLKPSVETVEGTVKTVVGPVYDKLHDVPIGLLKFVDHKVCNLSIYLCCWYGLFEIWGIMSKFFFYKMPRCILLQTSEPVWQRVSLIYLKIFIVMLTFLKQVIFKSA